MKLTQPSANKTAFCLITFAALFGFIFGLIKGEGNLNEVRYILNDKIEKEKVATEQRLIVTDLMRVARNTDFLREMPQDQALLWTTMVQMATPSPESSATLEWGPGVVPLVVSMSEPDTGISCHVVVGTIDVDAGSGNYMEESDYFRLTALRPCMVFYIGARPGQTYRFDNLNDMSTAKYHVGYGAGYRKFTDVDPTPMANVTRRLLNAKFITN